MTTPINPQKPLFERVIAIKGGGDLATGIALTLYRAGLCRVYIMETQSPSVIRRKAAFATAIYEGKAAVEGVAAIRVETRDEISRAWDQDHSCDPGSRLADPGPCSGRCFGGCRDCQKKPGHPD